MKWYNCAVINPANLKYMGGIKEIFKVAAPASLAVLAACAPAPEVTPVTVAVAKHTETPPATIQASATIVRTIEAARQTLTTAPRPLTPTIILFPTDAETPYIVQTPTRIPSLVPKEPPKATEVFSQPMSIWFAGTSTILNIGQDTANIRNVFPSKEYDIAVSGFMDIDGVTIEEMEQILENESVWPKKPPKVIDTMFESNSLVRINADHIIDPDPVKQEEKRLAYIQKEVDKIFVVYKRILTKIRNRYPETTIVSNFSPKRSGKYFALAQGIYKAQFYDKVGGYFGAIPLDIDEIVRGMCGFDFYACYQDYGIEANGPVYTHVNEGVRREIMVQVKMVADGLGKQKIPVYTPTRITVPVYP